MQQRQLRAKWLLCSTKFFCVREFIKTESAKAVQCAFRLRFNVQPPTGKSICRWNRPIWANRLDLRNWVHVFWITLYILYFCLTLIISHKWYFLAHSPYLWLWNLEPLQKNRRPSELFQKENLKGKYLGQWDRMIRGGSDIMKNFIENIKILT